MRLVVSLPTPATIVNALWFGGLRLGKLVRGILQKQERLGEFIIQTVTLQTPGVYTPSYSTRWQFIEYKSFQKGVIPAYNFIDIKIVIRHQSPPHDPINMGFPLHRFIGNLCYSYVALYH
jgi:hypothetical protein